MPIPRWCKAYCCYTAGVHTARSYTGRSEGATLQRSLSPSLGLRSLRSAREEPVHCLQTLTQSLMRGDSAFLHNCLDRSKCLPTRLRSAPHFACVFQRMGDLETSLKACRNCLFASGTFPVVLDVVAYRDCCRAGFRSAARSLRYNISQHMPWLLPLIM